MVGMHTLLDARGRALRNAEQLDPVAQLIGGMNVIDGDIGDALDIDLVRSNLGAEGQAGQDRSLCAVSLPSISKAGSASA
jgi:hypothetical protein